VSGTTIALIVAGVEGLIFAGIAGFVLYAVNAAERLFPDL
jgi:hypothetical protein